MFSSKCWMICSQLLKTDVTSPISLWSEVTSSEMFLNLLITSLMIITDWCYITNRILGSFFLLCGVSKIMFYSLLAKGFIIILECIIFDISVSITSLTFNFSTGWTSFICISKISLAWEISNWVVLNLQKSSSRRLGNFLLIDQANSLQLIICSKT